MKPLQYRKLSSCLTELTVLNTHQIVLVLALAVVGAISQSDIYSSLADKLQKLSKKFDEDKILSRNQSNRTSNNVDMKGKYRGIFGLNIFT